MNVDLEKEIDTVAEFCCDNPNYNELREEIATLVRKYHQIAGDLALEVWRLSRPTTGAVDSAEIPEVFNLQPKVVATGCIVFDDPPSN